MTITLPDDVRDEVERRATAAPRSAEELGRLLDEGADGGDPQPADAAYWDRLQRRTDDRAARVGPVTGRRRSTRRPA
jgi:hypothetical protein